jgi:hypothetical protein
VSACSSSPIHELSSGTGPSPAIGSGAVPVELVVVLGAVPDPQVRRGAGHGFVAVLAIAVCAVLAGACTFTAITEWARNLPVGVRIRLGLRRVASSESTIRRILQTLNAQALDAAVLSTWLVARSAAPTAARRMIAIDGKSARGSDRCAGASARSVRPVCGVALGQSVVDGKINEMTAFAPLLAESTSLARPSPPTLHTQHHHADYLIGRARMLTVKRTQPSLHSQLRAPPWATIPAMGHTHDKGHGSIESRPVKLTAVTAAALRCIGWAAACDDRDDHCSCSHCKRPWSNFDLRCSAIPSL